MEILYEKSIRPILDTFDKIRETLKFEDIEVPKIVVVGDQSSGKSSVLESITGINLPRGGGTVTKCPIIIQIRNVKDSKEEYASVRFEGDLGKEEIVLLCDLSSKIEEAQNELLKNKNSDITDTPLHVFVRKLNSPDLTLYDLPGMTYKNDILAKRIREIISKFTAGKETTILLVMPVTVDLTTSETLSLVRKNNDYKERTLAIITKIDEGINDKNLYNKIMNNEMNLNYDPIVVRNRTQEELDNNESIEYIRKKEMMLIETNKYLYKLPSESKGSAKLIERLVAIQKDKLISSKFEIKEKVLEKISTLKGEERTMPPPSETQNEKLDRFKECLNKLTVKFSNILLGFDINIHDKKKNIPSRFREKFEKFYSYFQKNYFFSDEFNNEIKDIITESQGLKLSNFADSYAFHMIISKEVNKIITKVEDLVDECEDYMLEILLHFSNEAFLPYPNLNRAVQIEIKNSIIEQKNLVKLLTTTLLECEMDTEWTVNQYYNDLIEKINVAIKTKRCQKRSEKESLNNSTMIDPRNQISSLGNWVSREESPEQTHKSLKEQEKFIEFNDCKILESELFTDNVMQSKNEKDNSILNIQISAYAYWKVFEKRFVDYYQMIILNKLVFYYKKELALLLEKKFSPSSNTDSNWLSEDPIIAKRRSEIRKSLQALESAKDEINKIM